MFFSKTMFGFLTDPESWRRRATRLHWLAVTSWIAGCAGTVVCWLVACVRFLTLSRPPGFLPWFSCGIVTLLAGIFIALRLLFKRDQYRFVAGILEKEKEGDKPSLLYTDGKLLVGKFR